MKRVIAAVLALALTGGCGTFGADPGTKPAQAASARSGFGSNRDVAEVPDPCTLLRRDEVTEVTGREVTEIDGDGAGGSCVWQLPDGQLSVTLTRTTAEEFDAAMTGAEPVAEAFWRDYHLYALSGRTQIDVYAHGGSEEQLRGITREVLRRLLPQL